MTYAEKLRDPRWQKRRLEILQRDDFTCRYCKDNETELHIHHLTYSKNPWDTDEDNLITLCKHCHYIIEDCKAAEILVYAIHKNEFTNHEFVCFVNTDKGLSVYVFDNEGALLNAFSYGFKIVGQLHSFIGNIEG